MNQKGFSQLILMVIVGVVLVMAGVGFWHYQQSVEPNNESATPAEQRKPQVGEQKQPQTAATPKPAEQPAKSSPVPAVPLTKQEGCPEPFIFQLPIDINKATSVLYPGQVRGEEYKAHGGFRFDNSKNDEITVTAPYDAYVYAGARYPVESGEIQYTLDFAHPCGIHYLFHHLLTLTPKFQAIAERFPLPKEVDSRTTEVYPPVEVKQGEVIATAVGVTTGGPDQLGGVNNFVDWGVYDYRNKNAASQNPDWPTAHLSEDSSWSTYYNSDTYVYAVCWFNWISAEDEAKVRALPSSDYQSGKTSDYCR